MYAIAEHLDDMLWHRLENDKLRKWNETVQAYHQARNPTHCKPAICWSLNRSVSQGIGETRYKFPKKETQKVLTSRITELDYTSDKCLCIELFSVLFSVRFRLVSKGFRSEVKRSSHTQIFCGKWNFINSSFTLEDSSIRMHTH